MKNILIIGFGNVGKALKTIEEQVDNKVYIVDVELKAPELYYDVVHITVPYTQDFLKIILDYLREYVPKLVIIHSTIPLTALKDIRQATGLKVVHTPVDLPEHSLPNQIIENKKEYLTWVVADTALEIKYAKKHLDDLLVYSEGVKLNREDYKKDFFTFPKSLKFGDKYKVRDVVEEVQKKMKQEYFKDEIK